MTAIRDARTAYDVLAPAYDVLTADYDHDRWLRVILALAVEHGLAGRHVLDVACGTGKSFLPLLDRGFQVTACDASAEMLALAAAKSGGAADLRLTDMRDLPALGRFDLITCLDDALNHLLTEAEVGRALSGMRRNLAPGGLIVFDVNLLAAYRSQFASDWVTEAESWLVAWRGLTPDDLSPGGHAFASIEVFASDGSSGPWRRSTSHHEQRHYPVRAVQRLIGEAGLRLLACKGQMPGVRLSEPVDEGLHHKALFFAASAT